MIKPGLVLFFDMGCSLKETKDEETEKLEKLDLDLTAGMNQGSCSELGGKWFRHAWTRPECEVPGFAWEWKGAKDGTEGDDSLGSYGSGTYMCCIHGEREWCHQWSMDDNEKSCKACGGTWRSIFKWTKHGGWVVGQWQKTYKWTARTFESANAWVNMIEWGGLLEMW